MRRTTRASPATTTTTTPVTSAQLKILINQGVANALATRNADRSQNGDDSHNSGTGSRRTGRTTQTVFNIRNYVVENQVMFATCTLHDVALTWWKSHVKTVGQDATHNMSWNTLIKMITAKYCPRNEIKKLEMDLRVEESDKIKKYVGGLPDMIHYSVMASKPNTMQDAVEFATELMDKKIRTFVERHKATCFEFEAQEYFKREYPKLKNNNSGNKGGNGNAPAKAYVVGNAGQTQTPTSLRKYMLKGCHVFLAHVTTKKTEDKLAGKQLEDVLIVRDFPEVFPEDLPGLPPTRKVEFQIDLILGVAPVAQAPY
nr:putative reverse transcriptase domain-containing protein [Tanacetum cinerariifolium]